MNTNATFFFNNYYHIYNRTNNQEFLFRSNENRHFFLSQYLKYLGDFLNIHSYALLDNHFHFSVKVKNISIIDSALSSKLVQDQSVILKKYITSKDKLLNIHSLIVDQHRRFFISYTQSFNKMYNRQGNLFSSKFKRSLFNPDVKFHYLQYYIHHNARKHGIVSAFRDYPYTSYEEILNHDDWLIDINGILERFGSLEAFDEFHNESHYSEKFEELIIE